MYIMALEAVSWSCFTTPHSRNRLPSISIPTSGAVDGRIMQTTMVITIGNRIFSSLDTERSCSILILRSFSVVRSFMTGGWMIGTSDIQEYAATAIGPIRCCCPSLFRRKIEVGPSAPPMMEIAAASLPLNPMKIAKKYARQIPSCAAAPMIKLIGFAISGPKSVIAPTPMKIRDGRILHSSRVKKQQNRPPACSRPCTSV